MINHRQAKARAYSMARRIFLPRALVCRHLETATMPAVLSSHPFRPVPALGTFVIDPSKHVCESCAFRLFNYEPRNSTAALIGWVLALDRRWSPTRDSGRYTTRIVSLYSCPARAGDVHIYETWCNNHPCAASKTSAPSEFPSP